MSKANNLTDFLIDVANAIRSKKGTTTPINPQDFSDEIASISATPKLQAKTASASATSNVVVTPNTGYDGLSKVTVNKVNVSSDNVKQGASILGIIGNYGPNDYIATWRPDNPSELILALFAEDESPEVGFYAVSLKSGNVNNNLGILVANEHDVFNVDSQLSITIINLSRFIGYASAELSIDGASYIYPEDITSYDTNDFAIVTVGGQRWLIPIYF